MEHVPLKSGEKVRPIKKIKVDRWDDDGNFTVTVKINKEPKLSASRKCYIYSFEQGETDIVVDLGGKPRKVRMTFILYVKIPATERRQTLAQEAQFEAAKGNPQLW